MRRYALCSLLSIITPAYAATIQVPTGQPTIQAAIDALANGDTIIVAPGTYTEHINYNGKTVTLRSSASIGYHHQRSEHGPRRKASEW